MADSSTPSTTRAARPRGRDPRRRLATLLLPLLAAWLPAGCSRYAVDMLRDNKLSSNPMSQPAHHPDPGAWPDDGLTWSWLGHATVLINLGGSWIVTDPTLHQRIGPPETFDNALGIRRITALPIDPGALPPIDLVLISHAHYDHLDLPSLRTLAHDKPTVVLPRRTRALLDGTGIEAIELDWLDGARRQSEAGDGLRVTAFRVEHYGHVPGTRRRLPSGFNGYLVEKGGWRIAFFGDTSYRRHRDAWGKPLRQPVEIDWAAKFDGRPIDLCILPIGDSHYRHNHTSPAEALRIALDARCDTMLPVHYGTFVLTPKRYRLEAPAQRLLDIAGKAGVADRLRCDDSDRTLPVAAIGATCRHNTDGGARPSADHGSDGGPGAAVDRR